MLDGRERDTTSLDEKWGNHWRLEGLGQPRGVAWQGGWVDSVYHQEAYILQHRDIEPQVSTPQRRTSLRDASLSTTATMSSTKLGRRRPRRLTTTRGRCRLALSRNIETIVIGTNRAVSAVVQERKKIR